MQETKHCWPTKPHNSSSSFASKIYLTLMTFKIIFWGLIGETFVKYLITSGTSFQQGFCSLVQNPQQSKCPQAQLGYKAEKRSKLHKKIQLWLKRKKQRLLSTYQNILLCKSLPNLGLIAVSANGVTLKASYKLGFVFFNKS